MVLRFPGTTNEILSLVTHFATHRERPVRAIEKVVAFPGLRIIPMGFEEMPVRAHRFLDLKKHYGPALFVERIRIPEGPRTIDGEAVDQPSRAVNLRGTGGNETVGSRAPFPTRP